jgi:hypothetical protein
MKTLNDYGKDVMDAQADVESIDANIASMEAALSSLKEDREKAGKALDDAKVALQEAADRIKSGDYGVADNGAVFDFNTAQGGEETPFEGLNRSPPDDEPDFQLPDGRTPAGSGAGF